ncbi:hybrid sensor histidine kinase/response regulator [Nostoc favosum]|uniref:histidine kinase n=1 Tax=Nostoc favosum CHAB5714 TaxID=2780399 RepID=A0ABS8I7T6_9NOSO|nr:PAS domain S-box protein [Nostoc favosum]MCC5600165.1 PAS domain S-box protein [Nostoc favosum CHAB5714]
MMVKVLEKILMMRSWLLTYGVMILAVMAALLLTRLLLPVFDPSVFTLFYAAVAISAWYGGMALGVLAIALSVTTALYFLIEPVYSFDFLSPNVLVRLTTFSVVSFLITALSSELRTARRKAETSLKLLQNSEMRFSRLAESNIIGVIVTDMNNGSIIEANDAFLKMVGYTREDFAANQMNWREITPHEYLLLSERSVEELRTTGVCKPFEKEYICKNGDRIPVLLGSVLVGDTQEKVIGFVVDLSEQQAALRERKQVEQTLREKEERLRLANERFELASAAVNCLIYDWNIEQDTVERTEGLTKILGYSLDIAQATGSWWRQLVHPEDLQRVEEDAAIALANGDRYAAEYRIRNQDNQYVYVLDQGIVVQRDGDGRPVRLVGITTDISERKQAEKAVQASEERLRSFVKANIVGILFGDVNGSITEANDEFLRIVGYTQADIQAGRLRWTDITPPEYQYLDELAIAEATAKGTCTPYEKECIRKDGSSVPVVVGYSLLGESQQNSVAFILDISDLQQAKKALSQSQEQFQAFMDNIPAAAWITNADGRVLYLSPTYLNTFDVATNKAINKNIFDLYPVQIAQPFLDNIRMVAQTNQVIEAIESAPRTDGTLGEFLVYKFPIADASGQCLVGGVAVDITERERTLRERQAVALERAQLMDSLQQQKEQLVQANRIKDEFLAVLSHELRTPLNPILGWSKLLQTKKYDQATTTRALETIERNAKLQTQLIEDLLDVSRILQGKLSLNIASVNLETAIASAIETIRLAAQAKSINLRFTILDFTAERYANAYAQSNDFGLENSHRNLESIDFNNQPDNLKSQIQVALPASQRYDPKFLITGDSGRLQQVIWNLLSNAIKFTPQGGQVEISLQSVGSQAQLRVSDTGKGISPDFLPFVFDYFRQADGATTRKFGGLGLGLAIVRHIVELHGGTVKAESLGEEQGATFTVMLPLINIHLNSHQIDRQPDNSPDLNGVKVLLVDDERDTRELIAFILEQSGAVVTQAASAMEALQIMPEFQPNLLLSDIGMPEVDGYTLIRQIRAMSQEMGGTIPAIALTAYAAEADYQQAIAAGFGQHITKPVEPAKLLQAIANLICSCSDLR